MYLYRWGHGTVYPTVGFPLRAAVSRRADDSYARSRHIAREQLGRISFGGQDVESSPAIESAIGSGLRTAQEVLAWL